MACKCSAKSRCCCVVETRRECLPKALHVLLITLLCLLLLFLGAYLHHKEVIFIWLLADCIANLGPIDVVHLHLDLEADARELTNHISQTTLVQVSCTDIVILAHLAILIVLHLLLLLFLGEE